MNQQGIPVLFLLLLQFSATAQETQNNLLQTDTVLQNLDDTFDFDTLNPGIHVYDIPEAKILPFRSYGEFKTAFINMDTDLQLESAKNKQAVIMRQNRTSTGPDKDAYANYKYTIRNLTESNNTLVFVSTEPGKGIFSFLNSIGVRMPWEKK